MTAPSFRDRVARAATRPFARDARVVAVADLAAHVRRLDLHVDGRPTWAAGQKVQFRVRGTDFRTYTPFDWDGDRVAVLVLTDSSGPGAAWAATAAPGTTVQVVGPRRAVDLAGLTAPPVLVGDETSLALAAAASAGGTGTAPAAQLYEATAPDVVTDLADRLGLGAVTVVARAEADAHHPELVEHAVALVRAHPGAPLVLTGKAPTIRAVRAALRDADLRPTTRVKAHWDPRRRGLD